MARRILLVLFVAVPVLVLVIGLRRRTGAERLEGSWLAARRRGTVTTVACFAAVIVFVAVSPIPAHQDVRIAALPALAGLVGVLVAGLGERFWPGPTGTHRVAVLGIRTQARDPGLELRSVAGLAGSAVLLALGIATAAPDGRSVATSWESGAASAGPYPGAVHAVPIGVALVALGAGTWWALRRVDARPALDPGDVELDRAVRSASGIRVLRFTATAALITAAGLALTMGTSLGNLAMTLRMNVSTAPQAPWDWVQNAGFALIAIALLSLILAAQSLLRQGPAVWRSLSDRTPAGLPQ